MEYQGTWTVFFALLVVLGGSVYFRPASVMRRLRPTGKLPTARFVKVWRLIGLFVAIVSLVELVAVIGWGRRL